MQVIELALALQLAGHDVMVLIGGDGPVLRDIRELGIPCQQIAHLARNIHPFNDALAFLEIIRALRNINPDLVSAHTAKAGFLGRFACAALQIPVIFTAHGWSIGDRISPKSGKVFRVLEMMASHFTDAIINVCDFEKHLALREGVAPLDKMCVIHNGVPDISFAQRAHPALKPCRLITIARLEKPKDHQTLLVALGQIKHLHWKMEWIGSGAQDLEAHALVAKLGICSRVQFSGPCIDIPERLAEAQVFLLSSRSEGFPRSILEAMRAGLPVIASDVGGVSEAVSNKKTGYVYPKSDVAALRTCLEALILNPELRATMGAAGRTSYEADFSFEKMLNRTVSVYHEVLRNPKPARLLGQQPGIKQKQY